MNMCRQCLCYDCTVKNDCALCRVCKDGNECVTDCMRYSLEVEPTNHARSIDNPKP